MERRGLCSISFSVLLQEKVGALNLLTPETFIACMVLGLALLSFPLTIFS